MSARVTFRLDDDQVHELSRDGDYATARDQLRAELPDGAKVLAWWQD